MPYPTVPDLQAFDPSVTPNLMAGGPYDQQLTNIENYLKSLGAYIDGTVLAAAQAAQSAADAAKQTAQTAQETAQSASETATAAQETAQTASETATAAQSAATAAQGEIDNMQTVTYTPSGESTPYPLFTSTGTAGTALAQIATNIGAADTAADTAQDTAQAAQTTATNAQTLAQGIGAVTGQLPTKIDGAGTNVTSSSALKLFTVSDSSVTPGPLLTALYTLLSNLMLAAPNGDTTKLLGYLADNTADLTTATAQPRSSAALTWASEQGSTMPAQNPESDATLTAGELSSTNGAVHKTANGNWLYVTSA